MNTEPSRTLHALSIVFRAFVIAAIIFYIAAWQANNTSYVFFRYITFFGSVLLVIYGVWAKSKFWTLAFCAVAVTFFPVVLIYTNQYVWPVIAILAAVILGLSIKLLEKKDTKIPSADAGPHSQQQEPQQQQKDQERPSREHVLWEQQLNPDVVMSVRNFLIFILEQLRPTDWEVYALKAVCRHSPAMSHLLVDGKLDVAFIKNKELEGMHSAIKAIKSVPVSDGMTLRAFFHNAFEAIYRETTYGKGDKFSWFGRDRVIATLRSYQVSTKSLEPHNPKFYDVDGKELELDTTVDADMIQKVKDSLDYFEKSREKHAHHKEAIKEREKYRFDIQSEHPYIEFDLDAVEEAGIFKYRGSLVNSLYEDMQKLLSVSSDYTYLGYYAGTDSRYDVLASSYGVGDGVLMLVKYKAAIEEFADRLYIEFQDLDKKSWVFQWITCHKLHIEGND